MDNFPCINSGADAPKQEFLTKQESLIESVKADLFRIFAIDKESFEADRNGLFLLHLMLRQFQLTDENYRDFIKNTIRNIVQFSRIGKLQINFLRILNLIGPFSKFFPETLILTDFQK